MDSGTAEPTWGEDELRLIARYLSKTGSFCGMLDGLVGAGVSDTALIALYTAVRDEGGRLELEWRPEFEALFPHLVSKLPPPSREQIILYWEWALFHAVVGSSVERVFQGLTALHEAGIPLSGLGLFAPESLHVGEPVGWGAGNDPAGGLTLLQVAERAASPEVVQLVAQAAASG